MGDSDDDYMSNDFLEQIQDVKPGLFFYSFQFCKLL